MAVGDYGTTPIQSYALASLLRDHRANVDIAISWVQTLAELAGQRTGHALWLRLSVDEALRRASQRDQRLPTPEHRSQAIPLSEPLSTWDRIDAAEHYITRLTNVWPAQLAEQADDPRTGDMLFLLRRWRHSGDAQTPAFPVFSRGNSNLENWLHDGDTVRCVDFEFSGCSDVAFDVADQIEHISSRAIPDHTWHDLEANLGVDHHNRQRSHAAQRTCALRWLAVLWKQRQRRAEEFTVQLDRVRQL